MAVSSVRSFWRRLEGSVHPDDELVLNLHPDVFDRQFPPPAFIGDVDNAPVVILLGNGSYDPVTTPLEFPFKADHDEYRQWLKGERLDPPQNLSSYYTSKKLFPLVRDGTVVYINAVAYRQNQITNEVRDVSKRLPSTELHKQWLRNELLPAAESGDRLVIAHRCGLWKFPAKAAVGLNNVFHCTSQESRSPHLPFRLRGIIDSWLHR